MEKKPVRTCVVCREKFFQDSLNRLQCVDKKLVSFTGEGRSFYVCANCVKDKKFIRYVSKICNISKENAKEMIFHFPFSIVK
jgi:predicted RNA-binding protein YlxR (DUF448 family)